jgi:hypothetical protein
MTNIGDIETSHSVIEVLNVMSIPNMNESMKQRLVEMPTLPVEKLKNISD